MYTEEEVKHYFTPRDKVIYSYVIQQVDPQTKKAKITDFLSFYILPSHVMNNPKHNMLNVLIKYIQSCYSFLNFATTVPYEELIKNALILANNMGHDVYNCLNVMENGPIFDELHFQMGDGHLNYYLYNWVMECKHIKPEELAVVLF